MALWLLPDKFADVLPGSALQLDNARERLINFASLSGYELVAPPLVEFINSLMVGGGAELENSTVKFIDQFTGRTLGFRADITPQIARIDAHVLNYEGVARLCYAGPVIKTLNSDVGPSRELVQFGAEIYGHAGLDAVLEVQELAGRCADQLGVKGLLLDMADAQIVHAIVAQAEFSSEQRAAIYQSLGQKDRGTLLGASESFPEISRALANLLDLFGGREVLAAARRLLPKLESIQRSLDNLEWLADRCAQQTTAFDLADVSGLEYYTGVRFTGYALGYSSPIFRGGRYDGVGAAFGRHRPAAGFTFPDLLEVMRPLFTSECRDAIRAPWAARRELSDRVDEMRRSGVAVVFSDDEYPAQSRTLNITREFVNVAGEWRLRIIAPQPTA